MEQQRGGPAPALGGGGGSQGGSAAGRGFHGWQLQGVDSSEELDDAGMLELLDAMDADDLSFLLGGEEPADIGHLLARSQQ